MFQVLSHFERCPGFDKKRYVKKIAGGVKGELWFMCMAHRLIVLNKCIKFHSNSLNCSQLTERTRNSIANDQREITQKYPKQSYGSCS